MTQLTSPANMFNLVDEKKMWKCVRKENIPINRIIRLINTNNSDLLIRKSEIDVANTAIIIRVESFYGALKTRVNKDSHPGRRCV